MDLQDIQAELRDRGVSYQDCWWDKDRLICRLKKARGNGVEEVVNTGAVTVRKQRMLPTKADPQERLQELRSKDLKSLKLMCSRRSIRYASFEDKENFVQAIWQDMQDIMNYSVSEVLRPGQVADVTEDELDQEMTSSDTPILVDVYAPWCGPCKLLAPEMDKVAAELNDRVRVCKLDSDQYPDWAGRYKVQGLPTTLVIYDGQVKDQLEGAFAKEKYLEMLQPFLQQ